jgi:hypothetical protein
LVGTGDGVGDTTGADTIGEGVWTGEL